MAEKGGPEGKKKREEPRKKGEGKEEQPVDTAELNTKRDHMSRMMRMIHTKDEILGLIEPSQTEKDELVDGIDKILDAGKDFIKKIGELSEKHTEIKSKQQLERKRKEEQDRLLEEQRKEEQRKRKEQQRIEEQRRKEQERKKQEQRKRQEKIADFKKQREEAVARIKAFDQIIKKQSEAKPKTEAFQDVLQFIEEQRSQLNKLLKRRAEESKKLQSLKTLALEVCDNIPLNPDLPEQAKIIDSQISANYVLEQQTYRLARQNQAGELRDHHPNAPIPTDHRIYNSPNFYELEISNIKQKRMAKLSELPSEEQEEEKMRIQESFAKLKSQQRFINQIKIFIELYQVDEETLQRNRFDFTKYKQLLARKNLLIQEKAEGSEEYGKVSDQMNQMTSKLNTGDFLMPFRYPLDLLVKAKNHLVNEYFEKQTKQLGQSLTKYQQANRKMQASLKELKEKLEAKKLQFNQAKTELDQYLQEEKQTFHHILNIHPQGDSQELQEKPDSALSAQVINQNEIDDLFIQLNDYHRIDEVTQTLEGRKEKRLKLQEDYDRLRESLVEVPASIDDHLSRTIEFNEGPQYEEQEEELARLHKLCEEIENRRQLQERVSEQSGIGRYSSFIL